MSVVVVHNIKQRREAPVVIIASLVCGTHEQTILTHKDPRKIHSLVNTVRRAIRFETVDADLRRGVQVPTRLGPKRLDVTIVAPRFTAKEFIAAFSRLDVEVNPRLRSWRRNR